MYGDRFIQEHPEIISAREQGFQDLVQLNFFKGHTLLCDMFNAIGEKDIMTPHLHKIKCPALIIAGGKDILKPPCYSEIIANNIPEAEYIVFPDAGHAVAVEKNGIIRDIASSFIKSVIE